MTHRPQRQTQIGALIAVVAAAAATDSPESVAAVANDRTFRRSSATSPEPSRASGDETAPGAHLYYAPKEQQR